MGRSSDRKRTFELQLNDLFRVTLTSANRIFILEPHWNPSVEIQAVARAQRMSQENSVLVTRYVVTGTVEEVCRQAYILHF